MKRLLFVLIFISFSLNSWWNPFAKKLKGVREKWFLVQAKGLLSRNLKFDLILKRVYATREQEVLDSV